MREWTTEQEEQLQRELGWVEAARTAVAVHSAFFFGLMNSSNHKIRELSILILGIVEKRNEITAADVIERIYGLE